jgi:SH3-like domain-containing protein
MAALAVQGAEAKEKPDPRRNSGLPVPRFVSLKSDEINVRSGPGTRYPILWVYRREGLPVEVIEEFEHWRKIRDPENTSGWVHKGMLDGTRRVLITGKMQVLRAEADDKAAPVLRAEPEVLAKLVECSKAWCRVQIDGRKGWLRRKALWGVYEDEEIEK